VTASCRSTSSRWPALKIGVEGLTDQLESEKHLNGPVLSCVLIGQLTQSSSR